MSEIKVSQPDNDFEDPALATALFFNDEENDFWRLARKERFDENNQALVVVPMVSMGERHDVAWLQRSWPNPSTGELVFVHQAACKCIAKSELDGDTELETMHECDFWRAGLVQRAININREAPIDVGQMLSLSTQLVETAPDGLPPVDLSLDPIDQAMLLYLQAIAKRPAYWAGNIVGGKHELPLLSLVTGCDLPQLSDHAQELAQAGWIKFDGDQTVQLAA